MMFETARPYVRAAAAAAGALLVFAVSWLYRFNDPGGAYAFLTDDHWFYLIRGWQILFGELPTRDFVDHGAPLTFYTAAAVQMLFGRGTLSELVFCVTVLSACAAGVFLLGARASGLLALGLAAAAFHVLLGPRFYNYPKVLVYVAAIPALWWFADRPHIDRVLVLAAMTVVAFLLRLDHGVFVLAAFGGLLVMLRDLPWAERVRHAGTYLAAVLVFLSPFLIFIGVNGGIGSYFREAAAWAARDRERAGVVWPGLFDSPDGVSPAALSGTLLDRAIASISDNYIAWLYFAELLLPVIALCMLVVMPDAGRRRWPRAQAKLGTVALLGILLNIGFLRSPLEARLADPSVPHAVLLAWLPVGVVALVRGRGLSTWLAESKPTAIAIRGTAAVLAVCLMAVIGIAVTHNLGRRLEVVRFTEGREGAFEQTRAIWQRARQAYPPTPDPEASPESLMTLVRYLRECTQPTDRVFMQHYLPQVLGLADRGFAGGHADLRPGFFTAREMQELTVERLRAQSVPVALLSGGDEWGGFRESFPIVTSYFDQDYEVAAQRTFDEEFGIRLLVRRDTPARRRFAPLDWPCFQ